MKDLEIRGAGTLLGVKQSGHISAVGFNLYCQLLAQAVEDQKAKQAGIPVETSSLLPPPNVDLPLPAYIPEDYISDLNTRLILYNKLVKLDKTEQIEPMVQEFEDRFGTLPPEIKNLLYAVKVKLLAAEAGIATISTEQNEIVLRLFEGMHFDKQKVDPVLKDGIKYHPFHLRFNIRRLDKNWQQILEEVLKSII
jgi:transcription-repair coupling factor (superfamily II helicase)